MSTPATKIASQLLTRRYTGLELYGLSVLNTSELLDEWRSTCTTTSIDPTPDELMTAVLSMYSHLNAESRMMFDRLSKNLGIIVDGTDKNADLMLKHLERAKKASDKKVIPCREICATGLRCKFSAGTDGICTHHRKMRDSALAKASSSAGETSPPMMSRSASTDTKTKTMKKTRVVKTTETVETVETAPDVGSDSREEGEM